MTRATRRRSAAAALVLASLGATAAVLTHPATGRPAVARTVTIDNFGYTPKRVTIKAGQRIRWTNREFANHSVTFSENRLISNLHEDESGTLRFKRPGTYKYVCDFHPNMHGTVVVKRR